ncbi:MAG: dTDP-4-dehydrorhamnose 3,5-epimerase [Thermoprotei archaeon]
MNFALKELDVKGVFLVEPRVFEDERGFFMETYSEAGFRALGVDFHVVQENHSHSRHGVLRGLHFQADGAAQAKLVRVVRGVVFDVAVDLRASSPTFGRYVWAILSEHNRRMLFVPRGFAHGFQVLSEDADFVYLVDNDYNPSAERGVLWCDPDIGVRWPVPNPILSEKDASWPTLRELVAHGQVFG